ncbi:hypothetical protein [Devosia psychrophila]|uniref:hypothetical protein n=1 Tax=Devosia psychrophila TaxID=728005 RepID=UPI001160A2CA|nr:hypothetical protein [Devosia psychrophila]
MQALLSTDRNRRTYPDDAKIAQPHVDAQAFSTLLSAGEPYRSMVGATVFVFVIVRSLADRYAKLEAKWKKAGCRGADPAAYSGRGNPCATKGLLP